MTADHDQRPGCTDPHCRCPCHAACICDPAVQQALAEYPRRLAQSRKTLGHTIDRRYYSLLLRNCAVLLESLHAAHGADDGNLATLFRFNAERLLTPKQTEYAYDLIRALVHSMEEWEDAYDLQPPDDSEL
jgi:hypothetical protein